VGKQENISTTNNASYQFQATDSFKVIAYNSYKVQAFLKELGLTCYVKLFSDNGFDTLESIAALTDDMLVQMGVGLLGHRATLLHACKLL
jgi:hypothetical protein